MRLYVIINYFCNYSAEFEESKFFSFFCPSPKAKEVENDRSPSGMGAKPGIFVLQNESC